MIILDGRHEKLWFAPGSKGTRVRKTPPTNIVLHHTAGEGGASQVYRTLAARGLGVHFVIDSDGRVTQMADPGSTVTFHGNFMNETSVGVEIVNRGVPPCITGHLREVYRHSFRGVERNFLGFYQAQVTSTWELLQVLGEMYGIPLVWPEGQDVMPQKAAQSYHGVLGHHHFIQTKLDPSPRLWDQLSALRAQAAAPQPEKPAAPEPA